MSFKILRLSNDEEVEAEGQEEEEEGNVDGEHKWFCSVLCILSVYKLESSLLKANYVWKLLSSQFSGRNFRIIFCTWINANAKLIWKAKNKNNLKYKNKFLWVWI